MSKYTSFTNVIEQMIIFFNEYGAFTEKKLQVIQSNQTDVLEEYLKEEQVYLLKLRGFDKKRDKASVDLGLKGFTFRQIIEQSDSEDRQELENLYMKLDDVLITFKALTKTTNQFVELNIYNLNNLLVKVDDNKNKDTNNYDKNGYKNTDVNLTFKTTKA